MRNILIAGAIVLSVAACTAQQIATSAQAVQFACADEAAAEAQTASQLKGGANTTLASYQKYAASVCGSADKIAAAAQDPSTAAWVAGITQNVKALPTVASK